MYPTRRPSAAVFIALIAAVIAFVPSASAPGSPLLARSPQAGEAEADIVRTNLAGRIEARLGSSFGGVWFEPEIAQLYVGVTSPASRQRAEAVAARAGLPEIVVETPVDSTWAQLQAAQDRWDERLMDLLERGEAATAVDPEFNAVEVELGSMVPPSRRHALERRAKADRVDILIENASYPHLGVEPQARCKQHVEAEALCDPTLVAGVTFHGEIVGGLRQACTTGPTVVKRNSVESTRLYVLTAGHCIKKWTGVEGRWFAYNKKGKNPEGEAEVGRAVAFLYDETDVGVVEVAPAYWATPKGSFFPVLPTIAPWTEKEPEPFYVKAQAVPVKNTKSCISGQKIGTACGEIIKLDQTTETSPKVVTKNLIEVEGPKTISGDSGAPWYAQTPFLEKEPTGYVEGTHVGLGPAGNPVFEPLGKSFEDLKELKGLDLELLTTANEKREHPPNPLTSPANTSIWADTVVEATSTNTTLHGTTAVSCSHSTVKAKITKEGGTTGPVEALTFTGCGNDTVTVVKPGSLSIAGNGTLTSNDAEVTVQLHRVIFFPITTHCIYATSNTSIGTLTEGVKPAVLHIGSSPIPQVVTDGACGSEAVWTGTYAVSKPTSEMIAD